MKRFRVSGSVPVWCSIVVEAEDEEGAVDAANELWPGLGGYAGNGALHGRLIGHSEENCEIIAPDDTPEWDEDAIEEMADV